MLDKKLAHLIPAAHTINSAGIISPELNDRLFSDTIVTFEFSRTLTPRFRKIELTFSEILSGRFLRILSPASIRVIWSSHCFSTALYPYAANVCIALLNSEANSTPVAPPPTIAIFSCSSLSFLPWLIIAFARKNAFTKFF